MPGSARDRTRSPRPGSTISAVAVLDPSARIVRRGGALTAPVDEELVMLDPEQSRHYGLNEVGASIWEMLEPPSTVTERAAAFTGQPAQ